MDQDKQENFEIPGVNVWEGKEAKKKAAQDKLTHPKTIKVPTVPSKEHDAAKDLQSDDTLKSGILGVKVKTEEDVSKDDDIPTTEETTSETKGETEPQTVPRETPKSALERKKKKTFSLKSKVDQIKTALSVKQTLMKLVENETEMYSLQKRMSNWLSSNKESALKVFNEIHVKNCLTYQQFLTAMVDLDSPFQFVELYALVIRLSDQEPGLISVENIMNNMDEEEETTVCDICGLGKTRLNLQNLMKLPERQQPIVNPPQIKDDKPAQLFKEFIMTKTKSKISDNKTRHSQSGETVLFESSPNRFEALTTTVRQKNMLVKWSKKVGSGEVPKKLEKNPSTHSASKSRIRRISSKLSMLNKRHTSRKGMASRSQIMGLRRGSTQSRLKEIPKLAKKLSGSRRKAHLKNMFTKAVANVTSNADKGKRLRKIFNMLVPPSSSAAEDVSEDKAEFNINRAAQPLVRFVLVMMRSIIHDDRVSCPAHFSRILTSDTSLSYLAHTIQVVNDVMCTQVYISPNRLRHRQSLLSLDSTLKQSGYRGYCKSHPEKVTLYYDFDIPEPPSFIRSKDLLDIGS